MSFLILFICFCGFEFPSGIMSSFHDSFASTYVLCATVVKYIIFVYIIGPTTYWYTNGCSQLLFKSAKEKKKKKYYALHFILNYIITFTGVHCLVWIWISHCVYCFQPEKLPLLFTVRNLWGLLIWLFACSFV